MKQCVIKEYNIQDKSIITIDNAINFSERESLYSFIKSSLYKIGNEDGDAIESSSHKYMCSYWSEQDLIYSGFLSYVQNTPVESYVKTKQLIRCHVNLSTPNDTYWAHDHRDQIAVLYYVNKHWKHEWAGETLFFNDDLSEIEFASIYKPGRIIIFDGEIPHTVRPQSIIAPFYRFTLSLFFKK